MLPSVSLAHSVEMLRDGGSLCASFQGHNGSTYWLVLPIVRPPASQKSYAAPVLVERPFAPEEIQLSWDHAKIMLDQVVQLLPAGKDRTWVETMYEAIARQGKPASQ